MSSQQSLWGVHRSRVGTPALARRRRTAQPLALRNPLRPRPRQSIGNPSTPRWADREPRNLAMSTSSASRAATSRVTVGGVALKPALALGGWVAFKQVGANDAVATGDLVLAEDEVGPVMAKLQTGGVEQTALHNHLLHESPHLLYMHIHARGDPVKVAAAIRAALALTKTPPASAPAAAPPASTLDTAAIHAALGQAGKLNGVVYQVAVPRAETIRDGSVEIPPAMGVATSINFQSSGPRTVAATGDFVLVADEINPVIQSLASNAIGVTALHSHMLTESPRLFFMHFWANDDPAKVARGLRAALDKMNVKRS